MFAVVLSASPKAGDEERPKGKDLVRLQALTYLQTTTLMAPTTLLRSLQVAAPRRLAAPSRRYALHGHGPQYNEPTGLIFSEKVCSTTPQYLSYL